MGFCYDAHSQHMRYRTDMIAETGTIIAKDTQFLWVETVRASSCQSCSARSGCGQAVLGQLMDEGRQYKKNVLRVAIEDQNASVTGEVGSQVQVLIEEGVVLKTALLVYAAPLIAMFIGSAIAMGLGVSDGGVTLVGLSGLGMSFVAIKKWIARWDCDSRYQPHIGSL